MTYPNGKIEAGNCIDDKFEGKGQYINKHIYTWIGTFLFGFFGVDRFMRGQIGLGILKFISSGFLFDAFIFNFGYVSVDRIIFNGLLFGVWPLIDWIIALTKLSKYGKDFVFVDKKW